MNPPRTVVIGVGNEFRRDDGVGAVVASRIGQCQLPGVAVVVTDGEPTALLDAWSHADLAVLVDAVRCEPSAPGRVHRLTHDDDLPAPAAASTHGLGIPDAVLLAAALGRAPDHLVVYAVEAADLGHGVGLSPAVSRAVPALVRAVLAEIGTAG